MYLRKNGNVYNLNGHEIIDTIENRVYIFDYTKEGCFITEEDPLKIPSPLFDVDSFFRKVVLKSFRENAMSTGVILSGEKGTGKTVCAKLLAVESGLPIILVKERVHKGVSFFEFLDKLPECVVLFDEFEKNFKTSSTNDDSDYFTQSDFLSYLDGLSTGTKKLFLMTVNENVSTYLLNRPTRIKFFNEYKGVPEKLFNQVVETLLENKQFKKDLLDNINLSDCTIDIIVSIVKEINVQGIPYSAFKDFFNYRQEIATYKISRVVDTEGNTAEVCVSEDVQEYSNGSFRTCFKDRTRLVENKDWDAEEDDEEEKMTNPVVDINGKPLQVKDGKLVFKDRRSDAIYVFEKQRFVKEAAYI